MIDVALAEKLIEKIMEYTNYNINIMNEQGIIIGSCDRSRVGAYHEVAHRIITQKKNLIMVTSNNDYLGVRNGVNMPLMYKNKMVGVVDVTGVPDEVKPVAVLIKMAIETIIEYEMKKNSRKELQDLEAHFINQLLYEEEPDKKEMSKLAGQLKYRDDVFRIPILFRLDEQSDPEATLKSIKESPLHSKQDISAVINNTHFIVYKHIPKLEKKFFVDYRNPINEYFENSLWKSQIETCRCACYIGSLQNSLSEYRISFQHCLWLENNIEVQANPIVYFYDHTDKYLRSKIPIGVMRTVFGAFEDCWPESFISNYIEVIGTLNKNNYNLVTTSKELFIHKNTLIFRLEKIKEEMNMDPLHDIQARKFMNYLYYYFKTRE